MFRAVSAFILFLFSVNCYSQASGTFPALSSTTGTLEKSYLKVLSPSNDIIDGWEFLPYDYRSKTTPFLEEGKTFPADILMNDRLFLNVPVQYDTFQDEIVYTDTTRMISSRYPKIILRKEVIDSFCLHTSSGNMTFRKLRFSGNVLPAMKDGYYEIAYDGPTRLYVRHTSLPYRRDAINEYDYSPMYFIFNKGSWMYVKNQKEFLALFGNEAGRIKTWAKQGSIKLRKMRKADIVRVLKYFDASANQTNTTR